MKKLQMVMAVIFVLCAGAAVSAQDVKPAYDMTGIWRSQDPGTAQVFQNGLEIRSIYINRGFSHFLTGTYINPTTIKGVQYRRNRSNGCFTVMAITMNVQSPDASTGDWEAMDGNCDLRQGQKGSWRSQRDRQLEQNTWY